MLLENTEPLYSDNIFLFIYNYNVYTVLNYSKILYHDTLIYNYYYYIPMYNLAVLVNCYTLQYYTPFFLFNRLKCNTIVHSCIHCYTIIHATCTTHGYGERAETLNLGIVERRCHFIASKGRGKWGKRRLCERGVAGCRGQPSVRSLLLSSCRWEQWGLSGRALIALVSS